jgi:hypothetical protein
MMKRLAIIVPYRDRQQHLDQFVPHMRAYFARDKLDKAIDYQVFVVEQERGLPFNRGALKNAGFLLAEAQSDYCCFHDIDYLPIWADYSFAEVPTPIVWYGAEERPIAPGRTNKVAKHNLEHFFGGALIVPNGIFRAVNGYSNDFWGWGYEDEDIRMRFAVADIATDRRKGTFLPLAHDSEGLKIDATPSPIALVNQQLMRERWTAGLPVPTDGLSGLEFDVISRARLPDPAPERAASWELVKVRLPGRPTRQQEEAIAAAGARLDYRRP